MKTVIRPFQTHEPKLGNKVYIDPQATVIGQVDLADDVSVWPQTVIRGDVNPIKIGKRSNIQDGTIIHLNHNCDFHNSGLHASVGEDVTVGHRVILHGCEVQSYSLFGMGAIIMDDAVIEEKVLVAAGTLVPGGKILRSGYLYMGSPVQAVRKLKAEELEFICYSAKHYAELKELHR